MKDFAIAGLLYIGLQIGIWFFVVIPVALFAPSEVYSSSYINNRVALIILPFLAVATAGYIYAVKRNHERMRQVVRNLFVVFAIHQIGSLAWPYVEPLLNQARG